MRRSFSKKARKKKRIKRLSKISLPIFFANNVRFLGFTTTSRSYRFSRPKWLARLSFRSALKNNKKTPMPFANGVFKPHASTFDRNFTNFSYSNNRFFRLFSFRFNRFSKFRRSRRFYRKRWSLISRFGSNTYRFLSSARSNFFFDKKIISTKMGYFPTRFFFGSSRFALTQYLRVSRSQKFRVLKFLRKFSIDREHPVLRLGSRRHFNRFVYNHTSSLFPYLVTGNSSVHVNHLDLKVRRILPTVSSKPVFGQDFLTPNISSIHAFRFLWFKRLLFSDLLRSGWCADQDMGSKRPLFFNANSTDLDS